MFYGVVRRVSFSFIHVQLKQINIIQRTNQFGSPPLIGLYTKEGLLGLLPNM
jgi:hypothetical protein